MWLLLLLLFRVVGFFGVVVVIVVVVVVVAFSRYISCFSGHHCAVRAVDVAEMPVVGEEGRVEKIRIARQRER